MADTSFMRWALRQFYTKTQIDAGSLDAYYFGEDEFLNTSAGAGDAGKPIKLDANGHVDATMINDADIDHGTVGGLTDDDHTQYALLAGRSGGQTLIGGTAASNGLTIKSTSNATKGKVIFGNAGTTAYDEVNERFGIGTASPSTALHVVGSATISSTAIIPTVYGSSSASGSLTIESTSNATKGYVLIQPTSGNVGIGTATPSSQLHVASNSTGGTQIRFENSDTGGRTFVMLSTGSLSSGGAGFFQIVDSSSGNRLAFDGANNRLGIGTTAPSTTLHVVGATTLSSTLSVGTSTTVPTIYGASSANGDITIHGTSSATKTTSYVSLQPSGGDVVVGGSTTDYNFEVQDAGASNYRLTFNLNSSSENVIGSINDTVGSFTQAQLRLYASRLRVDATLNIVNTSTPSSASDTGTTGDIQWDTSYLYICTATNTWRRIAHATW